MEKAFFLFDSSNEESKFATKTCHRHMTYVICHRQQKINTIITIL